MDMRGMEPIFKGSYDVIVIGGGIAGVAASVSAARAGASSLLIEKSCNLGGLATGGLISWYEPLCDGEGTQMIYGIAEELIRLSVKYGFENLPKCWDGDGKNAPRNQRYSTFYSPGVFSAALDGYVLENGVDLRFDTLTTYPVMEGTLCKGVVCESINGREYFQAKVVIDATGDASLMHRAGVPTVSGKNFMTYIAHYCDMELAEQLCKDSDFSAFRKWMNTGSDMFGKGHPEGMDLLTGITAEEITAYMTEGKKSLIQRISQKDKHSFDIMTIPTMPQLRTIRRIVGACDFNAIDGETYPDAIGDCGDFRPDGTGKHYQIPFGALYNENFPNLLAAGRIISSPQGDGWEVARVIPTCALTGEAAGKAAAVCIQKNCRITDLTEQDIKKIRIPNKM
ncbi:MAG: FAD-dependent oxidoreductase [Clostridia bacterium]|nr:FAD-dependent oxidoreductase [Clostridia bacterium]